jgi:hypothetical protein
MLILWAIVGVFLGVIWVMVTAWTAARIRGDSWIEWVSDKYVWLALTTKPTKTPRAANRDTIGTVWTLLAG